MTIQTQQQMATVRTDSIGIVSFSRIVFQDWYPTYISVSGIGIILFTVAVDYLLLRR